MDEGTELEPLEIECPLCDGVGCGDCDRGIFQVNGCPNRFCSSVIPAIELFELFEKGLPPVSGGVLNQSAEFLNAVRFFTTQKQLAKAERNE